VEKIAFARTLETLHSMQAPRWFRWGMFAVTAIGFVALGSWWWGMAAALAIAGVVAVHEAGHWLAMKLAGFRDVQVFFVPGMGAATSGEKHDASPLTHLLVYLAGPLPGLLLALAAYAWIAFGSPDMSSLWFKVLAVTAMTSFIINFLNLLPVMPFDGGKIVDLFIVARLPWLRFVFSLCSCGLLFYSGFKMHDYVLRALGILFLFSAMHQYRLAKASTGLLRSIHGKPLFKRDFQNLAEELHHFLSQPQFAKWKYQVRLSIGLALLPRLLGRLPGTRETVFGLGIYIASLVLPLAAAIALIAFDPDAIRAAAAQGFFSSDTVKENRKDATAFKADRSDTYVKTMRERRDAILAAAVTPEQRLAALRGFTDVANDAEDYAEALRLAKLYYAQAVQSEPSGYERARAAKSLAFALGAGTDLSGADGTEYDRLLQEADSLLRTRLSSADDSGDALLLAEVLDLRADRLRK
jgi:Zn-dependent protease